jgi:transcriptional regulator with XRE-family HTH domain
MYPPGLRLRKIREAQGLTYREVEKASYEIAVKRGRPDFILHISRLADIENRNVIPTLHKLYSLAAILHLSALEISDWYEAPFDQAPAMERPSLRRARIWANRFPRRSRFAPSAAIPNCKPRKF